MNDFVYEVVRDEVLDTFISQVQWHMERGWIPQGGICYSGQLWAQAMVKEKEIAGDRAGKHPRFQE